MDKLVVNGEPWIRLHDICDILREVEDNDIFDNTGKVIDLIAHLMFYDEIKKAKTDEERDAAKELPGDFLVVKPIAPLSERKFLVFEEWKDKKPIIGNDFNRAMTFEYRSMAEQVAGKLGKDWRVVSMGIESRRITARIKDRLFAILDEDTEN